MTISSEIALLMVLGFILTTSLLVYFVFGKSVKK